MHSIFIHHQQEPTVNLQNISLIFFPEKRLRSLSIDSLSYALTMPSICPSHDSQTSPTTPRHLQVHGYTPSLGAVIVLPHTRAHSVAPQHVLKPGNISM